MIRENNIMNRVVSALLAISMLVTNLFNSAFATAYSETSAYEDNVGCKAIFNTDAYDYFPVSGDPSNLSWDPEYQLMKEDLGEDFKVVITDYYISDNEGDLPCLWYKVEAAPDCEAPEKLIQYPWVFQNYLGEDADDHDSLIIEKIEKDSITIYDANGNKVESVDMPQFSKPEFTAESALGESAQYQWQIEYNNNNWIDIYGEKSKTVKLSYGMLAPMLNDKGVAYIRCKSSYGTEIAYSKVIPVTVEMYQPKEPDIVVSESFVSSNGQTVSVTVSGSIPENATVQLEETDSTGVDVNPGESVVAALDISIMNANGTEWQPESGETVTVTLEASSIGLKDGNEFVVYHLHNGDVRVLGSYTVVNDTVSFEVDGFSKFVFALAEQTVFSEDYEVNIGKIATINSDYDNFDAYNDPQSGEYPVGLLEGKDYSNDIEFTIKDVYVSDIFPYSIYYQVEVKSGEIYSEKFGTTFWIYQGHQDEDPSWGTLVIHEPSVDEAPQVGIAVDGQEVTEITVSTDTKVTLTATPNMDGDDVTYKWQLFIPQADMWVDISGQTEENCTVNYGMVANRLEENGQAHIRCVTSVDGKEIISEPIAVNISEVSAYRATMFRSAANSNAVVPAAAAANYSIMPAADGDEVEGIKYTLTVRFVSGDSNNGIFQTYSAEFKQGEVRTINIPVPFKEGYHAVYNDGTDVVEVVDNAILMEGKSLIADEELIVRYYPNLTSCKVIHYIQNIDNDEYTIYEEEDLVGLTDSKVPDDLHLTEEELPGFYKIPYTRPSIAADGSTVIEIYYDRYYYLMNFDLGQGGYGVEPAYARYETEIEFGTPIRKGYIFKGWTLNDNAVTSPQTIPAYDCTIVADWEASTAEYTIVYWKENAEPNADGTYGYSYWTSRVVDATSGDTVSGRDDVANYVTDEHYFTYNDVRTDKDVLVKGDGSTVVNVYYLRNYYDIYFYVSSNNQNTVNSCQAPTHSHNDETCTKYLICGLKEDHVHGATCEEYLVCGITAHTHSSECCTKTEHSEHTSDCCTLSTDHTHTPSCYSKNNITVSTTATSPTGAPTNDLQDGYVYRYRPNNTTYRYVVYINGKWYWITGNGTNGLQTGTLLQPGSNCPGTHTHGDGKCTCALTIHTHGDGNCYCSKTAHTHNDNCYKYSCGKIQHTHTNNCYSACTKAEHTHNDGNCTNGNGKYLLKIIHAKYEADISAEWPVADNNINGLKGFAYWTGNGNTNQSSRVVTMNSDWAKSSGVKVNANYNSTKYQLNYWFEDFDQTDTTTNNSTRVYRNGKYYVLSDKYTQVAYYVSTNSWGYKEITGMVATAESASISNSTANLYYNRSTHTLTFESYNEEVKKETGVMFEKPLNYYLDEDGNCTVIPEYPTGTLEEGGYYFAGWYYTKECFEGTEYDFSTGTMPNGDLTLYAKWAPVEHTIEFYFDSSLSQKLSATDGFATQKVLHNNYGADPGLPGHPLDFDAVVWFYRDENGDEHPFDFSMQIKHDMKLYPHWRSNVFIDYEIHYLIEGTNEAIAEPTVGEELYGKSVTFEPKGQDDFYEQYREGGYFVFTPTHTIVMGESKCPTNSTNCYWDENAKKHIFTFYYSEGPTVPYTVCYLDKVTGDKIFPDKAVSDNRKAIVVENALIKAGYRPDEAQKSLVVVKDGTSNVITFYYEKDETATYYTITHYIKKYGTDEYVVYQETPYNAAVGDIVPNQSPLNLDGFTYVETENTILGGEVGEIGTNGEPGLEIKMYYDEKPVTIYYEVIGNFGGTVSPESNTMGIVYGTAFGSTATPESNAYRFVGWYADFEGQQLISTNPKFVPTKKVNEKWINGTVYYAKFELDKSSLTIQKSGAEPIDENQSFIFKVTGIDANNTNISITVVIHGNDSVTIKDMPIGKYRVEEISDWSWRYSPKDSIKEVPVDADGTTIPFENERVEIFWLDGNAWCDNWFGRKDSPAEEEVVADE